MTSSISKNTFVEYLAGIEVDERLAKKMQIDADKSSWEIDKIDYLEFVCIRNRTDL